MHPQSPDFLQPGHSLKLPWLPADSTTNWCHVNLFLERLDQTAARPRPGTDLGTNEFYWSSLQEQELLKMAVSPKGPPAQVKDYKTHCRQLSRLEKVLSKWLQRLKPLPASWLVSVSSRQLSWSVCSLPCGSLLGGTPGSLHCLYSIGEGGAQGLRLVSGTSCLKELFFRMGCF